MKININFKGEMNVHAYAPATVELPYKTYL